MAAPAYAADVIVAEPIPVIVEPGTFSWTGGYIGVNAGYTGGKFKHEIESANRPTPVFLARSANSMNSTTHNIDITASGFIGGVQAGYNWQFDNNVIVGVEADFQGSNLKAEVKHSKTENLSGGKYHTSEKASTKVEWFGTIRARLGYTPVDRFMVYATGGYAYGKVKSHGSVSGWNSWGDSYNESGSRSKTKSGWTVGAGAEYAIDNNWTLKTEYLYTDLGKAKLVNIDHDYGRTTMNAKVKFHTVRAGINYNF